MPNDVILSAAKDLDHRSRSFAALRMTAPRSTIFLGLLVAGAQFCLLLGRQDITASHEGRVAQTAREMLESGDWLVPRLAGKPRLQKPPLPYWCAAALWKISLTTQALPVALARLPAALCGALATLMMMDLGRRFFGRSGGVLCGLVWLSTFFVVDEFRKAMADPYLAFFTLAAVWAWTSRGGGGGAPPPKKISPPGGARAPPPQLVRSSSGSRLPLAFSRKVHLSSFTSRSRSEVITSCCDGVRRGRALTYWVSPSSC
jgi:hypothetical protein